MGGGHVTGTIMLGCPSWAHLVAPAGLPARRAAGDATAGRCSARLTCLRRGVAKKMARRAALTCCCSLLLLVRAVTGTGAPAGGAYDPYPVLWDSNSIDDSALEAAGIRKNTHQAIGSSPVIDWPCQDAPASYCTAPFHGYCLRGVWPLISADGVITNGGVPQAANLTEHLDEIRRTMPFGIALNYTGIVAIDFESWSPIWSEDTSIGGWHSALYQNRSISLVLQKQPTLPLAQAKVIAKRDFQAAGLDFFVQTIKLCRALRPNARWGYCKHSCPGIRVPCSYSCSSL